LATPSLPLIFSSLSTPSPTKSSSSNNSSSNLSVACFSVRFRRFSLRRE
jgi:hypothetical protein